MGHPRRSGQTQRRRRRRGASMSYAVIQRNSTRRERERLWLMRSLVLALLCGLGVGVYLAVRLPPPRSLPGRPPFHANVGVRALVTNEYAYYNPTASGARSSQWVMTSGSLFARDGAGWSGVPDDRPPGRTS